MGAHSSFTIGMFGAPGGTALERGSPADSAVFVGYKTASGRIHSFPFFKDLDNDAERYSQSSAEGGGVVPVSLMRKSLSGSIAGRAMLSTLREYV